LLAERVYLAGLHLEEIERLLGRGQQDGLERPGHLLWNEAGGRELGRSRGS